MAVGAAVHRPGRVRRAPACGWWCRSGCSSIRRYAARTVTGVIPPPRAASCCRARRISCRGLFGCAATPARPHGILGRRRDRSPAPPAPAPPVRSPPSRGNRQQLERHVVESVLQLEHQALRLLPPDATDRAERRQVAAANAPHRALRSERRQQREGELGAEAAGAQQPLEDRPLRRAVEADTATSRPPAPPARCRDSPGRPAAGSRSATPSGHRHLVARRRRRSATTIVSPSRSARTPLTVAIIARRVTSRKNAAWRAR